MSILSENVLHHLEDRDEGDGPALLALNSVENPYSRPILGNVVVIIYLR